MASEPSHKAVMKLDKGEEIVGGWASPVIPEIGIYKLLAKQKLDGTIEWAHFIHRDNGSRDKVMRGMVNSRAELDLVIEITNKNLRRFFGVAMQATDYEAYLQEGRKGLAIKQ